MPVFQRRVNWPGLMADVNSTRKNVSVSTVARLLAVITGGAMTPDITCVAPVHSIST